MPSVKCVRAGDRNSTTKTYRTILQVPGTTVHIQRIRTGTVVFTQPIIELDVWCFQDTTTLFFNGSLDCLIETISTVPLENALSLTVGGGGEEEEEEEVVFVREGDHEVAHDDEQKKKDGCWERVVLNLAKEKIWMIPLGL
jgi:hypothetical protein